MRAAAQVAMSLPQSSAIDIEATPISEILSRPVEELTEAAREWRQAWFDFTADKTIKQCLEGVIVEGDEGHRVDRAINGKLHGGAGGDRKDFPLFVARKFRDVGTHLSHWEAMDVNQRNEVLTALSGAILGEFVNLHGRAQKFQFKPWPEEVCEAIAAVIKKRLKGKI